MVWLKLTKKSLYLMDEAEYSEKVELTQLNSIPEQYKLDVPLNWLNGSDRPSTMIIALQTKEEPAQADSRPVALSVDKSDRRYIYITRSSEKFANGLWRLDVKLMNSSGRLDRVSAVSGAPSRQVFRLPHQSMAGSSEPLPEGYWDLGVRKGGVLQDLVEFYNIERLGGSKPDFTKDWPHASDGLGPIWVEMSCRKPTPRSAIGFHVDNNSPAAPGTDGCVGIVNDLGLKSLRTFVSWFNDPETAPHLAIVDWDLGTVKLPSFK